MQSAPRGIQSVPIFILWRENFIPGEVESLPVWLCGPPATSHAPGVYQLELWRHWHDARSRVTRTHAGVHCVDALAGSCSMRLILPAPQALKATNPCNRTCKALEASLSRSDDAGGTVWTVLVTRQCTTAHQNATTVIFRLRRWRWRSG